MVSLTYAIIKIFDPVTPYIGAGGGCPHCVLIRLDYQCQEAFLSPFKNLECLIMRLA